MMNDDESARQKGAPRKTRREVENKDINDLLWIVVTGEE